MTDPTTDLTVWSVTDYDDEIFHGAFLDRDHAMESAEAFVRDTYQDATNCEFRWTETSGVFELESRTSSDDTWYDTLLRVGTLTVNSHAVGPDDKPLPGDGRSTERRFRNREDRLGAIVKDHAEMITAGREGNQLLTWMGDVDQTHARPSWVFGKQIRLDFLMTGLDEYKSVETCPRVTVVLRRGEAQDLIGKITDALREQAHQAGEDCGVCACGPCSFDRVKAYDEQQRAAAGEQRDQGNADV